MVRIDFHRAEGKIDRQKPAELNQHMSDNAWAKFCDDVDAIGTVTAKRNQRYACGLWGSMAIFFVVLIAIIFLSFASSANPFGLFAIPIVGFCLILPVFLHFGKMNSNEAKERLGEVLAETSKSHPNVSFHLKEEWIRFGKRRRSEWYIEANCAGPTIAPVGGGSGADVSA